MKITYPIAAAAELVQVFGQAQAHHGYVFADARATRIKLLVHDGFGVWCAARRLNAERFAWPREEGAAASPMTLTQQQVAKQAPADTTARPRSTTNNPSHLCHGRVTR